MHMGEGVLPAAACSAVCTSVLYALRSRTVLLLSRKLEHRERLRYPGGVGGV